MDFSKTRIGCELVSSHISNDLGTRIKNDYSFCISQSNEINEDNFLDLRLSAANNNNTSQSINENSKKLRTIVNFRFNKNFLNYKNDELENWIYFMFTLFIVTVITIVLCLIAKYFIIKI